MSTDDAIRKIWPNPGPDLTDDQLVAELLESGPGLRMNFVSSVDGAATHDGLSAGLSGPADNRYFELLRRVCDVVLVGAGTVRDEGYGPMRVSDESVRWRLAHGKPAHPIFAIASGSLALDPESRIFTEAPVRPIVVTTLRADDTQLSAFRPIADVVVAGGARIDIRSMMSELAKRGHARVLSEGGPTLFGSMIAADAVDELCLTLSPQLESGDAPRIANGELPHSHRLNLAGVMVSDSTLLLRYSRPAA